MIDFILARGDMLRDVHNANVVEDIKEFSLR